MLDIHGVETFLPQLHERFRLVDGSGSRDIELVEVTQLGEATAERRAPFSLVFRDLKGVTVPQRIHRLEHAELGVLELFLVPIGPGRYEAIFT
jgi:hypothetical protein